MALLSLQCESVWLYQKALYRRNAGAMVHSQQPPTTHWSPHESWDWPFLGRQPRSEPPLTGAGPRSSATASSAIIMAPSSNVPLALGPSASRSSLPVSFPQNRPSTPRTAFIYDLNPPVTQRSSGQAQLCASTKIRIQVIGFE